MGWTIEPVWGTELARNRSFILNSATIFEEGEFRLLDLDATEYSAYKEFFSTRAVNCARVFWFRPRLPEITLFGAHWILTATWRMASLLRQFISRGRRRMAAHSYPATRV